MRKSLRPNVHRRPVRDLGPAAQVSVSPNLRNIDVLIDRLRELSVEVNAVQDRLVSASSRLGLSAPPIEDQKKSEATGSINIAKEIVAEIFASTQRAELLLNVIEEQV